MRLSPIPDIVGMTVSTVAMETRQSNMTFRDHKQPEGFEEGLGGFLQDPSLWVDRLPQPFRTIDEVLQELLSSAWEAIGAREIQRESDQARVHVPKAADVHLLTSVEGVNAISSGRGGLVFVGSSSGLTVLDARGGAEEEGAELLAQSEGVDVRKVETAYTKDVHFLAVLLQNGVKVFAYVKSHLVLLTDVPLQDGRKHTAIKMAPSCTHLSVTTHFSDQESSYRLEIYQLPIDAWHEELQQYVAKVSAAAENEGSARGSQVSVGSDKEGSPAYSKISLVLTVHPPKSIAPCTANEPATALQSAFDGSVDSIATGEHHILTQKYFENRRTAFILQRADFVSEKPNLTSCQQSFPTCHFLYYKNATVQVYRILVGPSYLAVWWEQQTQLFFYSLEDSTKGSAAVPHRVFPQASIICSSAVSADRSLLAVGLQSGVVLVWNQKTGLCAQAISAVNPPDSISAMEFLSGRSTDLLLAVGTKHGKVLAVPSDHGHSTLSVNQRVSKQQEAYYGDLVCSSGHDCDSEVMSLEVNPALRSAVISVHRDGSAVLWSLSERKALCKLELPQSFVVHNALCIFSGSGDYAFIAGRPLNQEEITTHASLFSMHLCSLSHLTPHWHTLPTSHLLEDKVNKQLTMFETMERKLAEFMKLKYEAMSADLERRMKRWNEFAQELQTHIK